jgi:phytoene dehydrogenase-like protein
VDAIDVLIPALAGVFGITLGALLAGLAPYLAPPPALPWRRLREDAERSFPAFSEYIGIKRDGGDPEEITQMLDDWYAEEAAQLSEEAQQGA